MDMKGLMRLIEKRLGELRDTINTPYQSERIIREAEEKQEFLNKLLSALGKDW